MASKPKSKTFIVLNYVGSLCKGRYRVGARNEREAEHLLREKIGKHMSAKVYYEDKNRITAHGSVTLDYPTE